MAGIDRIQKRFDELSEMADQIEESMEKIEKTVPYQHGWTGPGGRTTRQVVEYRIDSSLFLEWQASVLSLLDRILPPGHTTIQRFDEMCRSNGSPHSAFRGARANFLSAKSDFEGGFLFDVRNLIHAEVFDNELDLAAHYLKHDGKTAAAVVAGVVLETTLRKLVAENGLTGSMLNAMNESLRSANVYSQIIWRQIQAWADIRNAAAHGKPDEFDESDVQRMIDGVRDFIANHMC